MMTAMLHAALAALTLGAISTLGDFLWAYLRVPHRIVTGVGHGAVLCLAIGGIIGLRAGRPLAGLAIGPLVGVIAAGAFYLLAPMWRWNAMFPAWMLFWICFGLLQAWLSPDRRYGTHVIRGVVAAVLSGVAFYLVSGMWTNPPRGGPNYAVFLLNWTFAFFPGFLSLFWPLGEFRAAGRATA